MSYYDFLSQGLPENNNQPNVFITLITSNNFCFNRQEIWQILDKYNDKWLPVNSVSYQSKWYDDYTTDTNPSSRVDVELAIDEVEQYVGKENIVGFSIHVPWYWDTSDDTFTPVSSIVPVVYESQEYVHLYAKEKDEGYIHYDETPRAVTSITRNGGMATATLNNHGLIHGYTITISGAKQWQYNGTFTIYNVTNNTFSFTVPYDVGDLTTDPPILESPVSPATGNMTVSCRRLVNASGTPLLNIPYTPTIGGVPIGSAKKMPTVGGIPIYGGTPDDDGLVDTIQYILQRGYKFVFYSFTEVIDPPTNTKPWRGNLLPTVRTLPQLLDDIKSQCVFYANLLVANNLKPYAFITSSEMVMANKHKTYTPGGQYTDGAGQFNFTTIAKWQEIYTAVKAIFTSNGWPDVNVGYSADWSELNGFNLGDGYYFRPLDELVMSQDMCFIDAYYGVTEDRTTDSDFGTFYAGWTSGRDWDYYISDYNAWKNYTGGKSPITMPEFAAKNLKWWYENTHDHVGPAPGYVRTQTPWTPGAKKIFFPEVGCPSISSGASEPNLFFDPGTAAGGIARGAVNVVTITRDRYIATATVAESSHDFKVGDKVMIAGANEVEYNGEHTVAFVSDKTFRFNVFGVPNTPATGTINALKRNDLVQFYYLKSLIDNCVDGNVPVVGIAIWQGDSRPLTTLNGKGLSVWGDAWRTNFVHWLKYLSNYTILESDAGGGGRVCFHAKIKAHGGDS